jgi:hypothetical protein
MFSELLFLRFNGVLEHRAGENVIKPFSSPTKRPNKLKFFLPGKPFKPRLIYGDKVRV